MRAVAERARLALPARVIEIERPWAESDLLTIPEAVERIGGRQADARAWLRSAGLVRVQAIGGRPAERVLWRDVLAAWAAPVPAPRPRPGVGLPRADLSGPRRKHAKTE